MQPRLIVFDLNKTLIHENSWLDLNLAMGVTRAEDDMLGEWGREGIISDAQGQAILCALYQKRGNPTKQNILKVLQNYTYMSEARETVRELKKRGYAIALLSGSMDVLVEHVAEELQIEHWAANNQFVFDDLERLQRIDTVDNDDRYKLDQLRLLCATLDVDIAETVCVGDGANDVLLFDASGNGVTFRDSPYADKARYVIDSLGGLMKVVR